MWGPRGADSGAASPTVAFRSPPKYALGTIRGFPATALPLTSRSPLKARPAPRFLGLGRSAAGGREAMAGSCGTGGPAAGWKRHIVRQLRQRDRTQKALFLELVPACECAPGDLGDGRGRGRGSGSVPGFSRCDSSTSKPSCLRSFGPAGSRYPPSPTSHIPALSSLGSPWSPFLDGAHSWCPWSLPPQGRLCLPRAGLPRPDASSSVGLVVSCAYSAGHSWCAFDPAAQ